MSLDPAVPACFYRVSVKAAVINNQVEMLLVQEGDFGWCLPGGGLDHGEDPEQGLHRELQEEVSGLEALTVASEPMLVHFSQVERQGFRGEIPVCFVVYRAEVANQSEVQPGDHTGKAAFFTPQQIMVMPQALAYDERDGILGTARLLAA